MSLVLLKLVSGETVIGLVRDEGSFHRLDPVRGINTVREGLIVEYPMLVTNLHFMEDYFFGVRNITIGFFEYRHIMQRSNEDAIDEVLNELYSYEVQNMVRDLKEIAENAAIDINTEITGSSTPEIVC